ALGGSIQSFLLGLFAPLNGWIIDRKGAKTMLLAGVVTLAISYAFLANIHSLWQYYVVCFFLGLAGSWTHFVPTHLLVANWFVRKRGMAIGMLTTISSFGDTLIPLLTAI